MLYLNRTLIRSRIVEKYGGSMAALAERMGVHRSTVMRWLAGHGGGFPRRGDDLLALAGALDLDPSLLFTVPNGRWRKLCERLFAMSRRRRLPALLPALEFAEGFLNPGQDWPPGEVAAQYGRPWRVREFAHCPGGDSAPYALWRIELDECARGDQVWHFAREDRGAPSRHGWTADGLVVLRRKGLVLFGFNGLRLEAPLPEGAERFCVAVPLDGRETAHGVASLDPFSAARTERAEPGEAVLRFCTCGYRCAGRERGVFAECASATVCEALRRREGDDSALPIPH